MSVTDVRHPAKFTDVLLVEIARHLQSGWRVLDPFAGTGRIHLLPDCETVGVEIEPEWAHLHLKTIVGDALALPFGDETFDAIATSCCYGNRMADHHDARDNSRRITYRHTLGRALHPNNAGQLQWGPRYKTFHEHAWKEAVRVLKPGGRFILNVSDHIRKGKAQGVPAWHIGVLCEHLDLSNYIHVPTPRMRFGQNAGARISHEVIAVFDKRGNE